MLTPCCDAEAKAPTQCTPTYEGAQASPASPLLFDTHCHVGALTAHHRTPEMAFDAAAVSRIRSRTVSVGTREADWARCRAAYGAARPDSAVGFGVHPWYAHSNSPPAVTRPSLSGASRCGQRSAVARHTPPPSSQSASGSPSSVNAVGAPAGGLYRGHMAGCPA